MKIPKPVQVVLGVYLIISTLATALFFSLFFIGGYWRNYVSGPGEVIAKISPDGKFNAFVTDAPSVDGPNQAMYIESADKTRYLEVGHLIEDVDFIKDVVWSEDSEYVVFWSKDYITIVKISDLSQQKIYLGELWSRQKDSRGDKFTSGKSIEIEWIKFNQDNFTFKPRDNDIQTINLNK